MKVNIYCLYDPTTCKIRYIGRTRKLIPIRLIEHITKAKYFEIYFPNRRLPHKENWIIDLLSKGIQPKIKLLTIIEGWKESHVFERALINKYVSKKDLTNADDRGEGCLNHKVSEEDKKRISNTLKESYKLGKIKKTEKKVYIFNRNGNLIKEVNSGLEAALFLDCKYKSIHKKIKSKGSINNHFVSLKKELDIGKLFYIYNIENNYKEFYNTREEIMKVLKISRFIYDSLDDTSYSYNGWLINHILEVKRPSIKLVKDNIIYEFQSIREAANFIKCSISGIHCVLNGTRNSVFKFKKYE